MNKGWTLIVTFVKRCFTFACTYVYCTHSNCSHFPIPSCDSSGCCAKPSIRQIAIYFCWNRLKWSSITCRTLLLLHFCWLCRGKFHTWKNKIIKYQWMLIWMFLKFGTDLKCSSSYLILFHMVKSPGPGIWTRFRKGHFVSENPCLSISCFPLYSYITSNTYVICFLLSNEYSYIHTFSEHGG